MNALVAVGMSLAMMAIDRPVDSPTGVIRSTVAVGPRDRGGMFGQLTLAGNGLDCCSPWRYGRPIILAKPACVQNLVPANPTFSMASKVESFALVGSVDILSKYDNKPSLIHLTEKCDSVSGGWTVTSAAWDGNAGRLNIQASHGAVTAGTQPCPSTVVATCDAGMLTIFPPIPSKQLPPRTDSTIEGTLVICLDPIDGVGACRPSPFFCYYAN